MKKRAKKKSVVARAKEILKTALAKVNESAEQKAKRQRSN